MHVASTPIKNAGGMTSSVVLGVLKQQARLSLLYSWLIYLRQNYTTVQQYNKRLINSGDLFTSYILIWSTPFSCIIYNLQEYSETFHSYELEKSPILFLIRLTENRVYSHSVLLVLYLLLRVATPSRLLDTAPSTVLELPVRT